MFPRDRPRCYLRPPLPLVPVCVEGLTRVIEHNVRRLDVVQEGQQDRVSSSQVRRLNVNRKK